jgi:hypothetical protein
LSVCSGQNFKLTPGENFPVEEKGVEGEIVSVLEGEALGHDKFPS